MPRPQGPLGTAHMTSKPHPLVLLSASIFASAVLVAVALWTRPIDRYQFDGTWRLDRVTGEMVMCVPKSDDFTLTMQCSRFRADLQGRGS